MYLHLVDDESQINYLINRTNKQFPDEHQFFVLTKNGKFKRIKSSPNVKAFIPSKKNIDALVAEISAYKGVFVHNLSFDKARIINQSPKETIFIWTTWGMDYYYVYPELYKNIFLPYTKIVNFILLKYSLSARKILFTIHPFAKYLGIKSTDRIKQQAAKRIKYVVNNMPEHSDVFGVLNVPKENRHVGTYYSIEAITKSIIQQDFNLGNNILIGNSATNSSNHLDLFIPLSKLPIKNRKIVVPLSYNCKRYAKFINLVGRIIFKKQFYGLTTYLPLEKYNEILLNCNVMIFNHKRAQAFGNIIFGLWAGHQIFLRESNPIYHYLKSLDISVFSIDHEMTEENIRGLCNENQIKNRKIIESLYGEKKVVENYLHLLKTIDR